MKTKEEIKKWLLENCVNEYGNLDLLGLDFSDFEGLVFICDMKVKHSLCQDNQTVGKDLYQDHQTVGKDLFSHKLEDNEKWEDCETYVMRIKELKPITKKELAELGYELI